MSVLAALDQPVPGWTVVGALALGWLALIGQTKLASLESSEKAKRAGLPEQRPSPLGRKILWGGFILLVFTTIVWAVIDLAGS